MVFIAAVLAAVTVFFSCRLFFLRREIKRVTEDLRELNDLCKRNIDGARGSLGIVMLHKPLEALCVEINRGFEILDSSRIEAENHEAELRRQIANISHDLRTPLTAILGYLCMIKSSPQKKTDYLEIVESRSKAMQALVEQFYELSVLEEPNTGFALEPVDITAALTKSLLEHYALFEEKGIQPESRLPEQAVVVMCNARALERVFQNLIQNALKFARRGVAVSLSDEGARCVVTISNDAEKLSGADIDHLFERFYTADKSRSAGNTGLGLYIVKRLLEKTRGGVSGVKLENGWFTIEIYFAKTMGHFPLPI